MRERGVWPRNDRLSFNAQQRNKLWPPVPPATRFLRADQRDFWSKMRLSVCSQVPTAKIRNTVNAVKNTASDRSRRTPVALSKRVRLINRTHETFKRTYNGVGSPAAARLRAGYVKPNTTRGRLTSPLDTRQTIAGANSQNPSSGGSIEPIVIIKPNSM